MLHEHIRREPLEYPFMSESHLGGQSLGRIPFQTLADKVDKRVVRDISQLDHYVLETFLLLLLGQHLGGSRDCVIFELGEEVLALGNLQNVVRDHPDHVDKQLHLLSFIRPGEQWEACE